MQKKRKNKKSTIVSPIEEVAVAHVSTDTDAEPISIDMNESEWVFPEYEQKAVEEIEVAIIAARKEDLVERLSESFPEPVELPTTDLHSACLMFVNGWKPHWFSGIKAFADQRHLPAQNTYGIYLQLFSEYGWANLLK